MTWRWHADIESRGYVVHRRLGTVARTVANASASLQVRSANAGFAYVKRTSDFKLACHAAPLPYSSLSISC